LRPLLLPVPACLELCVQLWSVGDFCLLAVYRELDNLKFG
jgi:hypothetical protein